MRDAGSMQHFQVLLKQSTVTCYKRDLINSIMTTLQQSMALTPSSGEMEELLPLVKQLTDPDQVSDIAC
jgi:hypothetical protein